MLVSVFGLDFSDDGIGRDAQEQKEFRHVLGDGTAGDAAGGDIAGADDLRRFALAEKVSAIEQTVASVADLDSRAGRRGGEDPAAQDEDGVGFGNRLRWQVLPFEVFGETTKNPAVAANEEDCKGGPETCASDALAFPLPQKCCGEQQENAYRSGVKQFQEDGIKKAQVWLRVGS